MCAFLRGHAPFRFPRFHARAFFVLFCFSSVHPSTQIMLNLSPVSPSLSFFLLLSYSLCYLLFFLLQLSSLYSYTCVCFCARMRGSSVGLCVLPLASCLYVHPSIDQHALNQQIRPRLPRLGFEQCACGVWATSLADATCVNTCSCELFVWIWVPVCLARSTVFVVIYEIFVICSCVVSFFFVWFVVHIGVAMGKVHFPSSPVWHPSRFGGGASS